MQEAFSGGFPPGRGSFLHKIPPFPGRILLLDVPRPNSYNKNSLNPMFRGVSMDETVHYLLMASHLRLQKQLLDRLKGTGLTLGQPKGAGLPPGPQRCQPEGHRPGLPYGARLPQRHPHPDGGAGPPPPPGRRGDRRTLHVFLTPRGPFGWSRSPRPFRSWRTKPSKASPAQRGCFPPDPAKGL